MLPLVGSCSRLIIRSSVLFPAPDRPITPTICPAGMLSVMPSTAAVAPKRRVRSLISSMAASIPGRSGCLRDDYVTA